MAKDKCCICYNPVFDKLIYESKFTLEKLSNEITKSIFYGFSCDKNAEKKADILQNYLRVLVDENRKISLGGEACLDCYNLQSLAEKVRKLTTNCNIEYRKDLIKDDTKEEEWIAKNPFCVSREKWEKLVYAVCGVLDIEIVAEEKICDLDVDVISIEKACDLTFEIFRKVIPCDVIISISVYKQMCDLDMEIKRTEKECKLDFEILINEINCDLDFKMYKKLVDCNFSFDIIKTIYENGCTFEIGEDAEVYLKTELNKYPVSSFSSKTPDIKKLKQFGLDTSKSQYMKNANKFVKKLKQDYSG